MYWVYRIEEWDRQKSQYIAGCDELNKKPGATESSEGSCFYKNASATVAVDDGHAPEAGNDALTRKTHALTRRHNAFTN